MRTAREQAPLPARTRRRRDIDASQDNYKGPSSTPPEPRLAPRSPRVSTPAPVASSCCLRWLLALHARCQAWCLLLIRQWLDVASVDAAVSAVPAVFSNVLHQSLCCGAVGDYGNSPRRKQPSSGLYARPQKNLSPPIRPNYVVHEVLVKRTPLKVSSKSESSPSATATISTSPMSRFAGTSSPCADIDYASASENPASIRLPFVFHYGDCGCSDPCRIDTCRDANMSVFCTDKCCVWEAICANHPRESNKVAFKQEPTMGKYAQTASVTLERVEVLGEYLGRLRYVEVDRAKRQRNDGYMLTLRTRTGGMRSRNVGIDAHALR
ncbi:hypothetical protein GN958_ATG08564 [Phytophthora infestans]|uniref:Uncharacterized protein n=2 Tax=Phytophthora infestans TaxID=4787 RepID=A0A8S9UW85_PHYIN|nr:hypothetical protein GN958_ATG08564 [Phytophthora infestans]